MGFLMNSRRSVRGLAALLTGMIVPFAAPPAAAAGDNPDKGKFVVGGLVHDRGPAADRHEHGYDVNLEYRFPAPDWTAWGWIGSPRPHIGATISTNGETSIAYTGLTYDLDLAGPLFAEAQGGLAVHNGMMHQKDVNRCQEESDCGFGSRVLFHGGLALGARVSDDSSVSLMWDHVSHGKILASENEGIDHVGIRYAFQM